jgi:hypothetical protein
VPFWTLGRAELYQHSHDYGLLVTSEMLRVHDQGAMCYLVNICWCSGTGLGVSSVSYPYLSGREAEGHLVGIAPSHCPLQVMCLLDVTKRLNYAEALSDLETLK